MGGVNAITNKLDSRGLYTSDKYTTTPFDPAGKGFDINSALDAGMTRQSKPGPNQFHFGSVAPTTLTQQKQFGMPRNSYMILKGRGHSSYKQAVRGENERGFQVIQRGNRSFSVPNKIGAILGE